MNTGEDTHRHVTRIVADEHLVDFEYRAEFAVQNFRGNVRQVEIDLVLAADTHAVDTDLKYLARGDVARDEVAVSGIFLFEEVPALALGNRRGHPRVAFSARHPNTSAFTAR